MPFDLEGIELGEYKGLDPRWHDWRVVKAACSHLSTDIFDRVCDLESERSRDHGPKPDPVCPTPSTD